MTIYILKCKTKHKKQAQKNAKNLYRNYGDKNVHPLIIIVKQIVG